MRRLAMCAWSCSRSAWCWRRARWRRPAFGTPPWGPGMPGAGTSAPAGGPAGVGDGATYDIGGHVQDYCGTGVAGAEVDWGWWDATTGYNSGGTNRATDTSTGTDISASSGFRVTSATVAGNDDLTVYYPVTPASGRWTPGPSTSRRRTT